MHCRYFSSKQRGAALVVSLMMLLVMTVIGVAAVQGNIMEERMAGNYRDHNLAFQAAEVALRDAEADISSRISGLANFAPNCTNGLCDATGGLSQVWKDNAKEPNGVPLGTYTNATALSQVAQPPKYWIEGYKIQPPGSAAWKYQYRITAVGYGGDANTRVVLQTIYAP